MTTTAVVVDVNARDGRGTPITDLQRAEFEILEDGVLQEMAGFSPPTGTADPAPATDPLPSADDEPGAPPVSLLGLVFGRLSPEAVGFDALGNRAGVARARLDVPAFDSSAVRVSSLVLVGRTDRVAKADAAGLQTNPMILGDQLIIPNTGTPISRHKHPKTAFFVSILPAPGSAPKARLELLQENQVVGSVELALARPVDAYIKHAGQLPTGRLSPGNHRARLTVSQGSVEEVREAVFTVNE